jgi:hypothetical protein
MNIILNLIATNKYIEFLPEILDSVDLHFFPDCNVDVIVHTNVNIDKNIPENRRIKVLKNIIDHEPWPFTTLKRFHYFNSVSEILLGYDYVFYIDVDSSFIKRIDKTILKGKGLIGTIHPCLYYNEGSPERNPNSEAYIPIGSNNRYFCGGFIGGSSKEFLEMSREIIRRIESDLSKGIIAVWHDESHINKYFYQNPPITILDHPFAAAENLTEIKEDSRILFLDKSTRGGHDFFRN